MSNISESFKSLSHPIRVQILLLLAEQLNNGYQFTELSRELQIESSSKLSFHMDKLHEFISQDQEGRYYLNSNGQKAVDAIHLLGIEGRDPEQIAQILATPVKVEQQSEMTETAVTDTNDYSYGLVFLGSLSYFLFIVLGIPLISLIILSSNASNDNNSTIMIIVPAILLAILSISLGMIMYALISRQNSIYAWQDMSFFLLVLSVFFLEILGIITYGTGMLLLLPILEYLLVSLGIYLIAQLQKSKAWSNTYLRPYAITDNRLVLSGMGLLLLLSLPFYSTDVTISAQPSEETSMSISSSFIGSAGLAAFSVTLILLAFVVLFHGRRPIMTKYQVIYLLLVSFSQVAILVSSLQSYAAAIDINRNAGVLLVVINVLGNIAYVFGAGVALKLYHTHFKRELPQVQRVN